MSFTLLVPADGSQPMALCLSEAIGVREQARQLFGGLWEVVRARGLDQLAPELRAVMLVDENGQGKGLPLNRRAGALYGANAIVGDALICQEHQEPPWLDELRGFTQEKAEQLLDLLMRRVGRGRG
jgi:hypothetical protein